MSDSSVTALVEALRTRYGDRVRHYASPFERVEEEHGVSFTIDGIDAIFSAITLDGRLPFGRYDIQFESNPPGDYIYTAQVNLQELLALIDVFAGPESLWPTIAE